MGEAETTYLEHVESDAVREDDRVVLTNDQGDVLSGVVVNHGRSIQTAAAISPVVHWRQTWKLQRVVDLETLRARVRRVESLVMDAQGPLGAYSELRGQIVELLDGRR